MCNIPFVLVETFVEKQNDNAAFQVDKTTAPWGSNTRLIAVGKVDNVENGNANN